MSDQIDKNILPSFGMGKDQMPACILTVLRVGDGGHDCAAYQGIVPAISSNDRDGWIRLANLVARGGQKISEKRARALFDIGALEYRR